MVETSSPEELMDPDSVILEKTRQSLLDMLKTSGEGEEGLIKTAGDELEREIRVKQIQQFPTQLAYHVNFLKETIELKQEIANMTGTSKVVDIAPATLPDSCLLYTSPSPRDS